MIYVLFTEPIANSVWKATGFHCARVARRHFETPKIIELYKNKGDVSSS